MIINIWDNMKYIQIIVSMLFIIVFCSIISCEANMNRKVAKANGHHPKNNDFFYMMSQEEYNAFKTGIKNLSKGDSYDKIIRRLGKPYSDEYVRGKRFDSPILSRYLFYYIKQYKENLVNERHDRYVIIVLDNNKLTRVRSNCAEIKEMVPTLFE